MSKPKQVMKTLEDIKRDMSALYDDINGDRTDLKKAAELANVAGKFLKADQLEFARSVFVAQLEKKITGGPAQLPDLTQ